MERGTKVLAGAIVAVVLIGGISAYLLTRPTEIDTIRIGYQPSTHQVAAMLAAEHGWWEEDLSGYGIKNVKMVEFPTGPPEMHAMLAGDLDIAYVGTSPPIAAMYEGLNAKIVAGVQSQGSALVVRPELVREYEENGPTALKGKRIATFPPGSIQHTILSKWLLEHEIDPKTDVDILAMGPSDAITAIGTNAVDAVFLPSPSPAIITEEGNGVVVEWSGSMWPNHACCCIVVSEKMIREHPEIVKQIIKTHIRATEYAKEHPDEAVEVYTKWTNANISTIRHSMNITDMRLIHDPHIQIESGLEFAKTIYELNRERYELQGVKPLERNDIYATDFYDEVTGQ